ncbi:MAG: sterol desaturase family protein [Nannocystaceae bacterium]|nr:sterol desaturase family protein [Nannocystaceae bacterium]
MTRTEQIGNRLLALGLDVVEHVRGLFLDPSARTFWGGLLAALIVAVLLRQRRGTSGLRLRQFWNRSARVDYGLVLSKPVLAAVLGVPSLVTTLGVAMGTLRALRGWLGPVGPLADVVSPWLVTAVYTLALFVVWDLSRFGLHWLMHRSTLLWQLHQVHHSASSLTPLTLYRVHPVESALYQLRGVLVTGLMTGVFSFAFGPRTVELQLWGVNALGLVFSIVSGNLRHSHVRWGFGARLERWLISPAQHQLHHSQAPEHGGANLGTWLAVWDRIAGSLRASASGGVEFGLLPGHCNHRPESLLSALFDPLVAVGARALRRPQSAANSALLLLVLVSAIACAARSASTAFLSSGSRMRSSTPHAHVDLDLGNATRSGYAVSRTAAGIRLGRHFSPTATFDQDFG